MSVSFFNLGTKIKIQTLVNGTKWNYPKLAKQWSSATIVIGNVTTNYRKRYMDHKEVLPTYKLWTKSEIAECFIKRRTTQQLWSLNMTKPLTIRNSSIRFAEELYFLSSSFIRLVVWIRNPVVSFASLSFENIYQTFEVKVNFPHL